MRRKSAVPESDDGSRSWHIMTWTMFVVVLIAILLISALPWLVRQATIPLVAAFSGR